MVMLSSICIWRYIRYGVFFSIGVAFVLEDFLYDNPSTISIKQNHIISPFTSQPTSDLL